MANGSFECCAPRPPYRGLALQRGLPFVNQIVTHMGGAIAAPFLLRANLGQLDGAERHVRFGPPAMPGDGLDRMAIAITCGKVHGAVNPRRVGAQGLFDHAQLFDKLPPVRGAEEAKAGNGMTHGHLVGRLVLAFQMHELLNGQTLFGQPLFEPAPGQMHHGILAG